MYTGYSQFSAPSGHLTAPQYSVLAGLLASGATLWFVLSLNLIFQLNLCKSDFPLMLESHCGQALKGGGMPVRSPMLVSFLLL